MLTRLKMWQSRRRQARSLYESIVTQARTRALYAELGVPDTPEGRFEMVTLHLVLVLDRLARSDGAAGQAGQRLARTLTETFAVDLDDNFREMSVGDLAVPKHVRRGVGSLHERYRAYRAALGAGNDAALTVAIQTRMDGVGAGQGLDAQRICAYIRLAEQRLERESAGAVMAGRIAWPHVDAAAQDSGGAGMDARGMTEGQHAR